jgi:hypothetical protein
MRFEITFGSRELILFVLKWDSSPSYDEVGVMDFGGLGLDARACMHLLGSIIVVCRGWRELDLGLRESVVFRASETMSKRSLVVVEEVGTSTLSKVVCA